MTFPLHTVTLTLHVMCVAGLVGGTLAGVVLRAAMLRADDGARRLTTVLLRVLSQRVELPMLLGAFATGALLLLEASAPYPRLWLGFKLALVFLAAGLGHIQSARLRRAAAAPPDPATLADLLHPGLQQVTLFVLLLAMALAMLRRA